MLHLIKTIQTHISFLYTIIILHFNANIQVEYEHFNTISDPNEHLNVSRKEEKLRNRKSL